MKLLIGVIFIAIVLADDKSFCTSKCAEKYQEETLMDACSVGCDGRALSAGPFAFIECQRSCDSKFSQENKSSLEAHSACSFACLLPMTSSVFMSVKYSNDGKPDVKIVRNNNGFTSVERPTFSGASDLDRFINNILGDVNRQILPFRNPVKIVPEPHDGNSSREEDSNADLMGSGHARMMAMQDHMNEMLAAFSRQFFDGIRRHMQRHRHLAVERPIEHDAFAHIGPEVGNALSNGDPIILTHPINGADEGDARGRPIKVVRYQMSSNHPPSIFYWIMIVFGVGALLLTLYASVIFFRVMRSAAYRRISSDVVAGRCPAAPPGPGPLPVKKVPLDGWVEHAEPSGVPPPAYDQVSIHSLQKQKQFDGTQQAHVTPSADSINPSSIQK